MFYCISIIFIECKSYKKENFLCCDVPCQKIGSTVFAERTTTKNNKNIFKGITLFNSIGTTTFYTNIKTVRMRRSPRFRLMNYKYDVSGDQSFFLSYLSHTKLQRFTTRAVQTRHAGSFNTPRAGYTISSILRAYPVIFGNAERTLKQEFLLSLGNCGAEKKEIKIQ